MDISFGAQPCGIHDIEETGEDTTLAKGPLTPVLPALAPGFALPPPSRGSSRTEREFVGQKCLVYGVSSP